MMIQKIRSSKISGFTLIELAIVLSIAGLLFVGLWRLLSGGNQQLRDQAAANQQMQLISAVRAFLSTPSGQTFMTINNSGCGGVACTQNATMLLPLPTAANPAGSGGCAGDITASFVGADAATQAATLCNSLPPGFSAATANSYGQIYSGGGNGGIRIRREGATPANNAPAAYSFMIVSRGGQTIPDTSGGRISAVIGGDGGFIYSNPVCGANLQFACGAYGAWAVDIVGTFGYALATAPGGYVASRTYVSPEQDASPPWLARRLYFNDVAYNTMTTDIFMGGNTNASAVTQHGAPNNSISAINFGAATVAGLQGGMINFAAPTIAGATAGSINFATPAAGTAGRINMGRGIIDLQGGQITGSTTSNINIDGSGGANPSPLLITTNGTGAGNAAVNIGTGCNKTAQVDPNCNWAIQIPFGDVSVAGFLQANALYSATFIYGTVLPNSDFRLKDNIRPVHNALDKIEKLKPVSFTMKNNGHSTYGVVAQDLEKVYPELVVDMPNGYKGVDYNGLIGPMIDAIQDLKKENDALRLLVKEQAQRQKEFERKLNERTP